MVNIFFLDDDIHFNCQYHCDKHVSKMILESTQILSTVCRLFGQTEDEAPYKPTHQRHPAVLWVRRSLANWNWLKTFTLTLNDEYKLRYERTEDHKSAVVCRSLHEPTDLEDVGITERPQMMPFT